PHGRPRAGTPAIATAPRQHSPVEGLHRRPKIRPNICGDHVVDGTLPRMSIVHDFPSSCARPDPELLMALRAAGCRVQEIAERIGRSRASAYRWLVRSLIPPRA